jgi:hypothetical protein
LWSRYETIDSLNLACMNFYSTEKNREPPSQTLIIVKLDMQIKGFKLKSQSPNDKNWIAN